MEIRKASVQDLDQIMQIMKKQENLCVQTAMQNSGETTIRQEN